ncbi:hypothetical protein [Nonomuraea salmonea]|uniref:Uncharacterized protein n=1 Tax=Nonomuraea salmonea TaxID=46181 RepID=A0ABV5P2N1_9ACTN
MAVKTPPKSRKPSVKIVRVHADESVCDHRMKPNGGPQPGSGCPGASGYVARCGCGCGWKNAQPIRAIVEEKRSTYLGSHPHEYAVRYTDEAGDTVYAYNPEMASRFGRSDAWLRTGELRLWQEDRLIEADAALVRRRPGTVEWEIDPEWQKDQDTYAALAGKVEAAFEAGDQEALAAARAELAAHAAKVHDRVRAATAQAGLR